MKAVILAGGLGTRLQPYTTFLPKPMLPLGEKPLLEHLVNWLKKNKIKDIVMCVSYLRKTIEDYFEDGDRFGIKIEYAIADRPLATAGQLKTAESFVNGTFACIYGDSIYNFDLKKMINHHITKKAFITMALNRYKTTIKYGVIETTKSGKVTGWNEKPEIAANINIGCYVMEPEVFRLIPPQKPYGMDDVIKKALLKKKNVYGYVVKNGFIDIGDKASYKKAYTEFREKLGKI